MLEVLSRAQIREFDRIAIEERQVPGLLLMENAGRGACDAIVRHFAEARRLLIVCGAGNNAGDGYVVARQLLTRGFGAVVLALVPVARLTGDARVNAIAYESLGGELLEDPEPTAAVLSQLLGGSDVVVDALFGTGLNRAVEGAAVRVIDAINASEVPVVALDLPSGIDADTGQVLGSAVRAQLTVSFAAPKLGLFTQPSNDWVGRLEVVDIGVPRGAIAQTGHSAELIETSDARGWASARRLPQHKGQAGRVMLIAGGPGTVGAARLCALGAHRAGAGLVTIASSPEAINVLEGSVAETMTQSIDPADPLGSLREKLASMNALAIGPGLGLGEMALELVSQLLEAWEGPLVMDADALTLLARLGAASARAARGPRVLTPHPAEAARLLGCDVPQVQADRFGAATQLAERSGATVLLKGRNSLIARPGHAPWVNPTGNEALAVGGAGDVLTGMVTALCCDLPAADAVGLGVWCHGRVADVWAEQYGRRGMLASDVAEGLPSVLRELHR